MATRRLNRDPARDPELAVLFHELMQPVHFVLTADHQWNSQGGQGNWLSGLGAAGETWLGWRLSLRKGNSHIASQLTTLRRE